MSISSMAEAQLLGIVVVSHEDAVDCIWEGWSFEGSGTLADVVSIGGKAICAMHEVAMYQMFEASETSAGVDIWGIVVSPAPVYDESIPTAADMVGCWERVK